MNRGTRITGIIPVVLFVLLLLMSGCVSPFQEKTSTTSIPHYAVSLPPLVIYTEEQPPFNYINERGEVSGRSTEMVREIMARIGADYPITLQQWTDGYQTVQSTTNTAIYSTILTHERDSMFKWVGPIAELQYSFYTRADNPVEIRAVQNLHTHGKIAVVRNDAREQYLKALNLTNILPLDDDTACMNALLSGEAEFWLGTRDISSQNAKRQQESIHEFRILDLPVISHQLYIAFNRKTPDQVIQVWQQALDDMKCDGTYDLIQNRYMPYICSWVKCTP